MITLLAATGNAHKVEEIRAGLGPLFAVLSQRDLGAKLEPVEDGNTFAANAAIKSVAWAVQLSQKGAILPIQFVLADDSGLEVDALGGAPGVRSARFATLDDARPGNSPDGENNAKLLRLLAGVSDDRRTARFRCVLALTPVTVGATREDLRSKTRWFEGTCEGHILCKHAGSGGFGYDPLFVPRGFDRSFAELGEATKNRVSHRAQALVALRSGLRLTA